MKVRIRSEISSNAIIAIVAILGLLPTIFYANKSVEAVSLILTFILMLIFVIQKKLINQVSFAIPFALSLTSCMFTVLLFGGEGAAITFMNLIMCAYVFNNIEMDIRTYKIIHFLVALILGVFLLTCDLKYLYAGSVFTLLNIRINSNMFGIFILACYCHWLCYISTIQNRKLLKWLISIILTGFSLYAIYLSKCRSALLSILILLLLLFFKKNSFSYKIFRRLTVITLVCGLLFTILYLYMFKNMDLYGNIIWGKNVFTGRQIVWESAWSAYKESPIIGTGTSHLLNGVYNSFTHSAHNTMLSILYTLGLIPSICFVFMVTKRMNNHSDLTFNRFSQFTFLATLVVTFFESFYTESTLYILFLLFLIPVIHERKVQNT